MLKFEFKGGDNTRFVESSLKKMKKLFYKDKQLKATLQPQFFTKPSKLKHDAKAKRIYIRKKFGDGTLTDKP